MEITLLKLWEMQGALTKLFTCDLPINRAYAAKKFTKGIQDHLTICVDIRNDLIKKHGVKTGDNAYFIPSATELDCKKYNWTIDQAEKANTIFNKELLEAYATVINIADIKFTVAQLEGNKLSMGDMLLLEAFISG